VSGAWRWLTVACSALVLVALVETSVATHAHSVNADVAAASSGHPSDNDLADRPSTYLSEPTAPDDLADDTDADVVAAGTQSSSQEDGSVGLGSAQRIGTTRASIRGPPIGGPSSTAPSARTTTVLHAPSARITSRTAARAVPSTLRVPSTAAHSVAFRPSPAAFASARAVPPTHGGHHATLPDVVVSAAARSSPVVSITVLRAGVTT
jgi:hypothetical protein